jgi:hypothetical protein
MIVFYLPIFVGDLVTVWQKENRVVDRAKRALWLKRREGGDVLSRLRALSVALAPGRKSMKRLEANGRVL